LKLTYKIPTADESRPDAMDRTSRERRRHRLKPDLFRQDWIALLELLRQRKIKPLFAQRFPLVEARRVQELLARGGVIGKIVLVLDGPSLQSGAA